MTDETLQLIIVAIVVALAVLRVIQGIRSRRRSRERDGGCSDSSTCDGCPLARGGCRPGKKENGGCAG